jgi:hypothetical protein
MDLKKILKIRKKMKTIPSLQYMTHGLVEEQETLGKTKRTKKMKTMIATTDAYTEDSNLGPNLKQMLEEP